jgi:hypothetical protein
LARACEVREVPEIQLVHLKSLNPEHTVIACRHVSSVSRHKGASPNLSVYPRLDYAFVFFTRSLDAVLFEERLNDLGEEGARAKPPEKDVGAGIDGAAVSS